MHPGDDRTAPSLYLGVNRMNSLTLFGTGVFKRLSGLCLAISLALAAMVICFAGPVHAQSDWYFLEELRPSDKEVQEAIAEGVKSPLGTIAQEWIKESFGDAQGQSIPVASVAAVWAAKGPEAAGKEFYDQLVSYVIGLGQDALVGQASSSVSIVGAIFNFGMDTVIVKPFVGATFKQEYMNYMNYMLKHPGAPYDEPMNALTNDFHFLTEKFLDDNYGDVNTTIRNTLGLPPGLNDCGGVGGLTYQYTRTTCVGYTRLSSDDPQKLKIDRLARKELAKQLFFDFKQYKSALDNQLTRFKNSFPGHKLDKMNHDIIEMKKRLANSEKDLDELAKELKELQEELKKPVQVANQPPAVREPTSEERQAAENNTKEQRRVAEARNAYEAARSSLEQERQRMLKLPFIAPKQLTDFLKKAGEILQNGEKAAFDSTHYEFYWVNGSCGVIYSLVDITCSRELPTCHEYLVERTSDPAEVATWNMQSLSKETIRRLSSSSVSCLMSRTVSNEATFATMQNELMEGFRQTLAAVIAARHDKWEKRIGTEHKKIAGWLSGKGTSTPFASIDDNLNLQPGDSLKLAGEPGSLADQANSVLLKVLYDGPDDKEPTAEIEKTLEDALAALSAQDADRVVKGLNLLARDAGTKLDSMRQLQEEITEAPIQLQQAGLLLKAVKTLEGDGMEETPLTPRLERPMPGMRQPAVILEPGLAYKNLWLQVDAAAQIPMIVTDSRTEGRRVEESADGAPKSAGYFQITTPSRETFNYSKANPAGLTEMIRAEQELSEKRLVEIAADLATLTKLTALQRVLSNLAPQYAYLAGKTQTVAEQVSRGDLSTLSGGMPSIRNIEQNVWETAQELRRAYEVGDSRSFMRNVHDDFNSSQQKVSNAMRLEDSLREDFFNLRNIQFVTWAKNGFSQYERGDRLYAVLSVRWTRRAYLGTTLREWLQERRETELVFAREEGERAFKLIGMEGDEMFGISSPVTGQAVIVEGTLIQEDGTTTPLTPSNPVTVEGGVSSGSVAPPSGGSSGNGTATIDRNTIMGWDFSTSQLVASATGNADMFYSYSTSTNHASFSNGGSMFYGIGPCTLDNSPVPTAGYSPTMSIVDGICYAIRVHEGNYAKFKVIGYSPGAPSVTIDYIYPVATQ